MTTELQREERSEGGLDSDLSFLNLYSDIQQYEESLSRRSEPLSSNLRYFLIKDIYRQKRFEASRYRSMKEAL